MNTSVHPLDAEEIERRLESLVFMVLTCRRSVEAPAQALSRHPRPVQIRFLSSVEFIASTSVELAFNFCMFAIPALSVIDEKDWQDWILHLMDIYDERGVLQCIVAMQKVQEYVQAHCQGQEGVLFEDIARVIQPFVCGLNGRPLRLATYEHAYTDTETLYLPPKVDQLASKEENYRLYKAMAVHLWAQTWFGTWRLPVSALVRGFPDADRALRLFHALETLRLDARIARELPGISREMQALRRTAGALPGSALWQQATDRLQRPEASVSDSGDLLAGLYREGSMPDVVCYQGKLAPERTEEAMALRQRREALALQDVLSVIAKEHGMDRTESLALEEGEQEAFEARRVPDSDWPEGFRVELRFHGEPVSPTPDVQQLLESVLQDFGDIPAAYLQAAGYGKYRASADQHARGGASPARDENTHLYDEWDHVRQHYRKEWCLLRERDVHPIRRKDGRPHRPMAYRPPLPLPHCRPGTGHDPPPPGTRTVCPRNPGARTR